MTTPTIHVLVRRSADPLADPNIITASTDADLIKGLADAMEQENEDVYIESTRLDNPMALTDYGVTPPAPAVDPRQLALL